MERKHVYFGSIEKAVRFVNIVDSMNTVVCLIHGSTIIDGKSLLGIFSLDLSEPVVMEVHGDDSSCKETFKALRDYIRES